MTQGNSRHQNKTRRDRISRCEVGHSAHVWDGLKDGSCELVVTSVRSVSPPYSIVIGFYTYLVSELLIFVKFKWKYMTIIMVFIHNVREICGFVRVDIMVVCCQLRTLSPGVGPVYLFLPLLKIFEWQSQKRPKIL